MSGTFRSMSFLMGAFGFVAAGVIWLSKSVLLVSHIPCRFG